MGVEDNSFKISLSFIFGILFFLSFLSDFLILLELSKIALEIGSLRSELSEVWSVNFDSFSLVRISSLDFDRVN